jgi:solute carrier family 45 protein 1/2/4
VYGLSKWDTVSLSLSHKVHAYRHSCPAASPYLLELGLSKSLMSLVFVAGPLSGLIMQPLIGVLADRSKSRFGRRRPFMLAGCVISVFAMMLLAWAREVAGWMGGGNKVAIGLAVWAIYLIDFVSPANVGKDAADDE